MHFTLCSCCVSQVVDSAFVVYLTYLSHHTLSLVDDLAFYSAPSLSPGTCIYAISVSKYQGQNKTYAHSALTGAVQTT